MNVPRRLYSTVPYEQTTVETLRREGEAEHLYLICPEGGELHDLDAARLGIVEYLEATIHTEEIHEEKAVDQAQTEDKAVAGPQEAKAPAPPPAPEPSDDPGKSPSPRGRRAVDFPPETQRS